MPVTPKAQIKRSRAAIENQRRVKQVGIVDQVAAFDHVEKCHEQQKSDSQTDHYDQGCACSCRLLFDSCHSCHIRILQAGLFPGE